ncbi:TonB-dependent receptor [Parahaliea sp. F7430]|uniref:TonB-dependent receptor n=1 Tax=Sediminihaliea albiluteola TaxID=2758564 RepID=A0A7W2YI85_9GAMM|nr:TonB-dependent receptor [Sediminihaliea albiluteola]MBA6411772.1 TonB-dependent receptor [Sediminihaliea albiluteola]
MFNNKKRLALMISLATAPLAHAQSGSGLVLEEIMVTAQRVVEGVQTVPVTVNAISGQVYSDTVGNDIKDLSKLTPGLSLESSGNNQNVTLRGIGTKISAPQSPRTNIYVDGVYQMQQQNSFFAQYDLERFEVLRGPQGTLYGKASPTGTIIIHTANPSLDNVDGYMRQTVGQHDLSTTEFGVSVPIIKDELAVRLAGIYDENNNKDYQYYGSGPSEPKDRTRSGRANIYWDPGNGFDLRFSYTYVDKTSGVDLYVAQTKDDRWGVELSPYDRESLSNRAKKMDVSFDQSILEMNYEFSDYVLTYQAYYSESNNYQLNDEDSTPLDDNFQIVDINFSHLFNNELRLSSEGNDAWDWIAGVYHSRSVATTEAFNKQNRGFFDINAYVELASGTEDYGAFIHNSIFLTDNLTLTLGGRWTKERRRGSADSEFFLIAGGNETLVGGGIEKASSKYIDWTGTTKLSYVLSPDEMIYATVDFGGRSGGQGIDVKGTVPHELSLYDPESATSYELGYKSDLFGGRMRFNAALYYQIYTDYQVELEAPINDPLQGITTFTGIQNAEEVIAQGAEIEVNYLLAQDLVVNIAVAYNDTKFEEFTGAACDDGNSAALATGQYATCNYSGQRVGGDTGNWSAVASTSYSQAFMNSGFDWYVDAFMKFDSFRIAPNTQRRSASYSTFDLFTGLRDDVWDLKLWVKNLTDKEAIVQDDRAAVDSLIPHLWVMNPRQFGATVTYRFE